LEWDGEPKDRSLDQDASVPVPARWQAASFLAHKKYFDGGWNISEGV